MKKIRETTRQLYRLKIRITTLFNWGYGEFSSYINLVKDAAIIIAFFVLIFKVHIGIRNSILLCVLFFLGCVVVGIILERTGMLSFANRISNKVNNEFMEMHDDIKEIKKHLGLPDGPGGKDA